MEAGGPKASTATTVSTKEQRRAEWARRSKHFFILSDAGKPIFSRWGDEQELATFMGVLQVGHGISKLVRLDPIALFAPPTLPSRALTSLTPRRPS